MRRRTITAPAAHWVPNSWWQVVEGGGCRGESGHRVPGRGWGLDRGVSVYPGLRESRLYPRGSSRQYSRGHRPLFGSACGARLVVLEQICRPYPTHELSQNRLEGEWEKDIRFSTSRFCPWLNASNWPRTCGAASSLTAQNSRSRRLKRPSSMQDWSSYDSIPMQANLGKSFATVSTAVSEDRADNPVRTSLPASTGLGRAQGPHIRVARVRGAR